MLAYCFCSFGIKVKLFPLKSQANMLHFSLIISFFYIVQHANIMHFKHK